MPSSSMTLHGQHILVAEDTYFIAQELTEALECEGAEVVGPVATVDDARRLTLETAKLDGAVLDVNLRGEMIWPVADILFSRHVRLVFATGFAAGPIKKFYNRCQVVEKPAPAGAVVRLLATEQLSPPQVPSEAAP